MRTIRWGIIGCGNVTEVKSGPGFQKARGSELVAVMRRDAAKAEDYARRHGVPRWYADAGALIADPQVDAVYIATPPSSHESYALRVAAAGKPCYVEKPMARNTAEAQRMVGAFERAGLPLFVAYYRRALPRFAKVRELLEAGALGRVRRIRWQWHSGQMLQRLDPVPWRLDAADAGGGLFLDLGSHALDLLDWWFGPLTLTSAQARNLRGTFAVEDHVSLSASTPAGAPVEVECSFIEDHATDEFRIAGEKGELRLSCFGNEPPRLTLSSGPVQEFDLPNPPHVAQPLIQTIVDELLGAGRCPSTGVSALRTQVLMDRALESYYGGREDGFWNRAWPGASRP